MRDTWPISAILVIWYGWSMGRVKARRGIEIERNPLREIEEAWQDEP